MRRDARRVPCAAGAALITALVPHHTWACEACFGQTQSPWIDASRVAVMLLLGVTLGVQVAFAWFFVSLWRRSKAAAAKRAAITLVSERGAG